LWLQAGEGLVCVRILEGATGNILTKLGKQLAGCKVNHGGNILMVQIENEYGSYGREIDKGSI